MIPKSHYNLLNDNNIDLFTFLLMSNVFVIGLQYFNLEHIFLPYNSYVNTLNYYTRFYTSHFLDVSFDIPVTISYRNEHDHNNTLFICRFIAAFIPLTIKDELLDVEMEVLLTDVKLTRVDRWMLEIPFTKWVYDRFQIQ